MKLICDWGSSQLRCYLLSDNNEIVKSRHLKEGIKVLDGSAERFESVLRAVLDEWHLPEETPIQMSGMVGSKNGWIELPYLEVPIGCEKLKSGWTQVPGFTSAKIMTGLKYVDNHGRIDVMRGEEIQIIGVLKDHPDARKICLPGTHSKWVTIDRGEIVGFKTYMTGDLFQALSTQTIFKGQIDSDKFDEKSFVAGCQLANEGCGLDDLFSLRSNYVFNRIDSLGFHSYLSGFLIANELKAEQVTGEACLCGSEVMLDSYAIALELASVQAIKVPSERATIAGHLECECHVS